MPSGSHGGSRGSHSSGGSRSGGHGGSFGGGRGPRIGGGHYHGPSHRNTIFMHHGRPRRIRWGHHYYVYGSRAQSVLSILIILLVFAMFFIFSLSFSVSVHKTTLATIEEDYRYYQDLISYAEANEDEGYIVDGIVTNRYFNEDAGKYYITYKFQTDSGVWVDGYTYSCYTLSQASAFRINSTIQLAVDSVPITIDTDSITLDYKYKSLEDDGEYVNAKSDLITTRVILWICIVACAGVVIGAITYAYKKKELADEKETKKVEDNTTIDTNSTSCAYCGATYDKSQKKCHCCGATLRK